ncbi:PIKK family atypical protein kinase [Histomonas meleagridis]|uniref:PIKK family atypical protein kinase n=1 Tax=Histomonas meleagridis TaxID=135588 RepID=UPI00355A53EF|nr:PIKK family atypical protein kinase [Histomonas meleagridis]KAH0802092.1 PIKK family atypical protein kinase [Histomonas meleagridis]
MEDNENLINMFWYYINQVGNQLDRINTSEFSTAIYNFEIFVEQQYLIQKEQNVVQDTLTDLLNQITRVPNPLTNVILLKSISKIDLGDKVQKANKMAHSFASIPSNPDPVYWEYLEDVLVWLYHTVPKTVEQNLNSLRGIVLSFSSKQDSSEATLSDISTFIIISILYKNFSSLVNSLLPEATILTAFKKGFQSTVPEVIKAVSKALQTCLKYSSINEKVCTFPLRKLCEILMENATSNKPEYIDGACEAIKLIIDFNPKMVKYLNFKTVPVHLLQAREVPARLAGFKLITLCYICTPTIFNNEIHKSIFKAYEPLIKKKTQNRNEALMGFGSYLFARKGQFDDEEKRLMIKCFKSVEELMDTEQAAYCAVALSTVKSDDSILQSLQAVYSLPLSLTIIEALYTICQIVPSVKEPIQHKVISMANVILLDVENSSTSIINAFKCLNRMEIPFSNFSVELILQYSLHMTNKDLETRKIASDFVLNYQSQIPTIDIVHRVLSVIATELNDKHRIYLMKHLNKHPTDRTILPSLQSLLHDLSPEIRLASLDYIAGFTHFQEASDLLKEFLTEKVHDLENSKIIYKEHILCFLKVSSAAFSDPNAIYAPYAIKLLEPFAQFLITHLLSSNQPLSNSSLKLLAQILPLAPHVADVDSLASQINSCLIVHSSPKRISVARDLLKSALDYTDLKFSIYKEHTNLIIKLIDLANAQTSETNQTKIILLKLLSSIGPISPSKISNFQDKTQNTDETNTTISPNIYLSQYTASNSVEALTMASIGVAALKILDILSEESLSALHSNAMEALLNIIRAYRLTITEELEAHIMKRITHIMTSGGASTTSVLIKNMSTFITILGEKFIPLVPHVVDLICHNWATYDQSLLTRISNWLMLYLPDAYIPHLPQITSVFVKNIDHDDVKTVGAILLSVYSFGTAVKTVDHILYPPLLNWIIFHANENIEDILATLKDILINGGAQKFSSQVLKTMIQIVEINPNLQLKALDIIFVVGVHIGNQFLLYVPHLTSTFNFNQKAYLNAYVLCLENGDVPPKMMTAPCYPEEKPKTPSIDRTNKQIKSVASTTEVPTLTFPMPQKDFDEGQWIKWCNELFSMMVKSSSSRAISVCESIIEKYSGLADALYPIAFTLFYFQYKIAGNNTLDILLQKFFKRNHVPRLVMRHFLASIELIEVLGAKIPIVLKILSEKAQTAECIAQSLRYSELLFEECDNSLTERLIIINQQLGLPLAANGILRVVYQRGFTTTQAVLAEKLGLWEDALQQYNKEIESDPNNKLLYQGKLNCIRALSKYSELKKVASEGNWPLYLASSEWRKKELAIKELPKTLPICQSLLGKWNMESNHLNESRNNFKIAIDNSKATPEEWSLWSSVNLKLYEETKDNSYLLDSLEGLLVGISLYPSDPLSFTLKILSILFRKGNKELYALFQKYYTSLPISVWIEVLPQIIARSDSNDSDLRELIKDLIYYVGTQQPHVVLYSLMVPLKVESARQKVAIYIFDLLRNDYPSIVEQMLTLANELIRIAVSWWEMWHSTLDEASRAYIMRKDNDEMINLLLPLHKIISKKPETLYELMFIRQFGQSLTLAEKWIKKYQETKEDECLYQAWQLYINVFHQLKPIINELTSILLIDASPSLCSLNNSELIIPGSFKFHHSLINLFKFEPTLTVMKSKQRPRRMAIYGNDGIKYVFLLKANEDTRLDERVMQFFALVNTLISHSSIPLKDKLTITTYKVIPITGQVGLIGWVPECNTIYDLVKQYREKHNVPLEIEHQTTLKVCPNFESLPLCPNKVASFRKGLSAQSGNDLKHIILSNSNDSNHWIERRTFYATSLAMTSMAGYILGLGDRHLSNIMFKKNTAKLVHIDFGDCFEVAMHREKFPEVVPFRLTRILQNALEVSKIEGTFRSCCQNVMSLFRENGNQFLGLLEVFIYDPLRQWINVKDDKLTSDEFAAQESSSAIDIMKRIEDKLTGRDIIKDEVLTVNEQVDKLITQATSLNNLCVMYRGWFPWW